MKTARCLVSITLLLLLGMVCFQSSILRKAKAEASDAFVGLGQYRLPTGENPTGLSSADWGEIRKQIRRYRHRIQSAPGKPFWAVNPGQQLMASFSEGVMWVEPAEGNWGWGLRLAAAGAKELTGPPAQIRSDGNRVYTRWNESLTEWVENGERGLEQGFTLTERPSGLEAGQPPVLTLAVRGGLSAQADPGGQQVSFQDREGHTRLTYGELKVIDSGGSRVPARLEGTKNSVQIVIDDRGAVYPLTVDPLVQQAYLKASNTGAMDWGDNFGTSVAIYGDTVVGGAFLEDSNATGVNGDGGNDLVSDSGAVYIFTLSNNSK